MLLSELADAIGDATNVLVLAEGQSDDAACGHLIDTRATTNLVVVTVDADPAARLSALREHLASPPDDGVVIAAGEAGAFGGDAGPDAPVRRVENPADLTALGIELSETLQGYPSESVGVCFDSLSGLLAHTDLERAFRFLHVVTNRLASVGATGHYHLDPTTHDDQTVDTLTALFDAVVEYDGGDLTVRTR